MKCNSSAWGVWVQRWWDDGEKRNGHKHPWETAPLSRARLLRCCPPGKYLHFWWWQTHTQRHINSISLSASNNHTLQPEPPGKQLQIQCVLTIYAEKVERSSGHVTCQSKLAIWYDNSSARGPWICTHTHATEPSINIHIHTQKTCSVAVCWKCVESKLLAVSSGSTPAAQTESDTGFVKSGYIKYFKRHLCCWLFPIVSPRSIWEWSLWAKEWMSKPA